MRITAIVTLALSLLLPTLASAQQDLPPMVQMSTSHVKPDMALEYEALLGELAEAHREAGTAFYVVYRVARGEVNEYVTFMPVTRFADFDAPLPAFQVLGETRGAQWVASATKCLLGRRVDTLRVLDDLSIPLAQGREAQLAILGMRRNLPGRLPEYRDWLENDYVPAIREAGMDGVIQFQNAFAARQWYEVRFVDTWAAFDNGNPLANHLGAEAAGELAQSGGSLATAREVRVLSLRPEISLLPQ